MMPAAHRCARIFLKDAALIVFACYAVASAQEAVFTVSHESQSVGTASFHITAAGHGYESTSVVKVSMQGLDYALSKTEELTAANELKHVQLSATVNGEAVNVTLAPDAAQLLLNTSANGRSSTTRLTEHRAVVFLPDFDPGALETLLALAATHNNAGLWAMIPKAGRECGSGDAGDLCR